MSRIGKKPIIIPSGVEVKLDKYILTIKGPKGTLSQTPHPFVLVEIKDGQLHLNVKSPDNVTHKALWGLHGALIKNMIIGVTEGFSKKLEINGVGYRVQSKGKRKISMELGFSHPVEFEAPEGIELSVEENRITISGIDKQLVGNIAAEIRSIRKPEPYKGKGIKYVDEVIRRKAGKVAKGATS